MSRGMAWEWLSAISTTMDYRTFCSPNIAIHLFRNQGGGRFIDVASAAILENPLWGTSAAFFDFDRDGWLDLIVVNYVDYAHSFHCPGAGGKLDFCGPKVFRGSIPRLYRNRGLRPDGKGVFFEDASLKAGLVNGPKGKGLGVLPLTSTAMPGPTSLLPTTSWQTIFGSISMTDLLRRRRPCAACLYAVRGSGEYGDRLG